MNKRLKELAFEAGFTITPCGLFEAEDTNLERFAELVRADEPQGEQEPVCDKDPFYCWSIGCQVGKVCKHIAQPEQEELIQFKDGKWSYVRKPWVGLTDEEILSAAKEVPITCIRQRDYDLHFAPIIEAKLKEKNTK